MVNQFAIVWHMAFHIGMRPVRAPDHAIGNVFDDRLAKGHHIVIGRAGNCQAFRAGDLDPDVVIFAHQFAETLKVRVINALGHIRAAQMINHHRYRHINQELLKPRQVDGFEIDNYVPAIRFDLFNDLEEMVARRIINQSFDKIEPHPRTPAASSSSRCSLLTSGRTVAMPR